MSSSPEIRKLEDEIKELKLRTYQTKLEQEKRKLLKEINNNNNDKEDEIKNDTKNENDDECDDECEEAGDLVTFDEREAEKKDIYKYIFRAILAYTLLMLFIFSTFYIIHKLRRHGCGAAAADSYLEEHSNTTDISSFTEYVYGPCVLYLEAHFNKNSAIVTLHNLSFGLVSAVVVSQIGSHQQQPQQSQQKNRSINKLTNQLLHAATKSTPGPHIMSRFVYYFITWTPRLYILTWIFTGCTCLLCGSIWGSEYSGPLFVTGQAWLGIAITTVYLFFGLQETAKENKDNKKEEDGVVNGHNNDNSNNSGDDSIDAVVDYNKHKEKDKKSERDLITGNFSEENNAVTSSARLQATTSCSRCVEEKDGGDEEEGTLYVTRTKSNDKPNDDDADDSGRSFFALMFDGYV